MAKHQTITARPGWQRRTPGKRWPRCGKVPACGTRNRSPKPVCETAAADRTRESAAAQARCRGCWPRFPLEHALTAAVGIGAIHRQGSAMACVQPASTRLGTVVQAAAGRDAAIVDCLRHWTSHDCTVPTDCPVSSLSDLDHAAPSAAAAASSASPVKRTCALRLGLDWNRPLPGGATGVAVLDHMLHQLASHALDLEITEPTANLPHRLPSHQRRRGHRRWVSPGPGPRAAARQISASAISWAPLMRRW